MMQNTQDYAKSYKKCQKHGSLNHQHSEPCHSIFSPWPFIKWRLDIIEKFPITKGGKIFILLAIDYFINWVEDEAYSNVIGNDVINFIWKQLICRFRMLKFFVMDNGT